ncbi:MAG: hypothetical protein ACREQN_16210, partial [Candidatus Binataceae bacterium]
MIEDRGFTGNLRSRIRLGSALTASLCAVAMVLAVVAAGCGSDNGTSSPPSSHFSFSTNGQGLWVANGTNVLEFAGPYKSRTPNTAPAITLSNTSGFTSTQGVQFDSAGNLWVVDGGDTTATPAGTHAASLNKFTQAQLSPGGTLNLTPNVALTSTALTFPQQAVFDTEGNLWVTNNVLPTNNAGVLMFTPAQLTAGGAQTPFGALENATFTGPLGLAFDTTGNLWVANNGGTTIFEFSAANIAIVRAGGGHAVAPSITLSTT